MDEIPTKQYTGVWIPAHITERTDLTPLEKWLWAEIAGFGDNCFASNEWFASRLGISERWVRDRISKLIDLGLVERVKFDGRKRYIRVALDCRADARVEQKFHAGGNKNAMQGGSRVPHRIKDENKSIDSSITNVIEEGAVAPKPAKYGNELVEAGNEIWKEVMGYSPRNTQGNRRAMYNFMRAKDKGAEWLQKTLVILKEALADRYSTIHISDPGGLQRDLDKLMGWASGRYNEQNKRPEVIRVR